MDRNGKSKRLKTEKYKSLSARRAWIEIPKKVSVTVPSGVALRKESVDRNMDFCVDYLKSTWSLSARRAWIEIQ